MFAGYGLLGTWLAGYVPVLGVLGLSALACLLAGGLVVAVKTTTRAVPVTLALLLIGGGYALGQVSWVALKPAGEVALVQGNIEQISKWEPENRIPIISTYEKLSASALGCRPADLAGGGDHSLCASGRALVAALGANVAQPSEATLLLGLPDVVEVSNAAGALDGYSFQNTAQALGAGQRTVR